MRSDESQSPCGAPGSPAPRSLLPFLLAGLLSAPWVSLAQNPTLPPPGQSQQTLQEAVQLNPGLADVIRQRLQQSGLSAEQVRARLQAGGYPSNLLDAYLSGAPSATLPAGALELAAIQALGLPPAQQSLLAVDTGLIRMRGVNSPSRVFGVDVFRRTTTQFLPLLSGPVPPDYKLGPGDQLVLILTGDVELAYSLQVTREGFVLIPQVGQVYVTNLTLDQLRDMLYTRLGRVYSGVRRTSPTTRFDVSVANVRVNQVYVVGEVAQPGAYQISSLGTVLTALYVAGGVTERADMRAVELRRLGKTVAQLDLYDYLLRGDTRSDVRLETGDVVFVPVHGTRAEVAGAVVRPAIYELKPGEALTDLLKAAGGFRPDAQFKRLAIYRLLAPGNRGPGTPPRAVIDVSLTPAPPASPGRGEKGEGLGGDPLNGVAVPSMALEDGDSVVVDSVASLGGQYYVAIAGMVRKPGIYPWKEGITLRQLVLLARGPTVGADLREAEVARMPADRTQGQLATTVRVPLDSTYLFERDSSGRYVGPPGLPFPGSGAPEVALQPYDNVLILKQAEFDFQRTVTITGQVQSPGTYSLRTKTDRLADLVHRAGGLTRQAYADGIRFFRAENNVGRINVDLPRALADSTSGANIILQPGDSVEIPEYQPAVKVSGAVNSAGSVLWKRGADLDYYLEGAGGFSYLADKGRVSVKYANGEVRTRHHSIFGTHDPKPGPGSEVFVPVKDTTEKTNYVALVGGIAQIIASTVTIIYVIHHP
jgi:polysaccharide biosynthesis/export protein